MKKFSISLFSLIFFLLIACSPESEDVVLSNQNIDEESIQSKISCHDRLNYISFPGDAIDVAANAGYIFKVAKNGRMYVWDAALNSRRWISLGGSNGRRITVTNNNVVWITNTKNEIYRSTYNSSTQTNSRWEKMRGKATDIGANNVGGIYILGDTYKNGGYDVYARSGNRWDLKKGKRGIRIAGCTTDGILWLIDKGNRINKLLTNDRWEQYPGKARDIAQGYGTNPNLFILGNTYRGKDGYDVYVFDDDDNQWCKTRGIGTNIAVTQEQFPIISNGYNKMYSGCIARPAVGLDACPSSVLGN